MKRYCDEHPEEWKDLVYMGVSYPEYEISSYGKLRNKATGKVRSTKITKGYVSCNINRTKSGKPKTVGVYIHRALAEAFIPNPLNKKTVNHIDCNRSNNNVSNLEWATYRENNDYALNVMKQQCKNKNNNKSSMTVIEYDLDMNFIKEYPSAREAVRQNNNNCGIFSCLKGKTKTSCGHIFKYKSNLNV